MLWFITNIGKLIRLSWYLMRDADCGNIGNKSSRNNQLVMIPSHTYLFNCGILIPSYLLYYIYAYIYTHICVCKCVCIHICIYTCNMYICIYTCNVCVCVYIYIKLPYTWHGCVVLRIEPRASLMLGEYSSAEL